MADHHYPKRNGRGRSGILPTPANQQIAHARRRMAASRCRVRPRKWVPLADQSGSPPEITPTRTSSPARRTFPSAGRDPLRGNERYRLAPAGRRGDQVCHRQVVAGLRWGLPPRSAPRRGTEAGTDTKPAGKHPPRSPTRIAWSRRPDGRFWSLAPGGAHFGGCAFSHACCFLSTSASWARPSRSRPSESSPPIPLRCVWRSSAPSRIASA